MSHFRLLAASISLAATVMAPAVCAAQNPSDARAGLLQQLSACRAITVADQRLACFDREAAALDAAEAAGDVVVVDRAQVRQTRQALFGLSVPSLTIFDRSASPERIDRIATTITRASEGQSGWVFTLEDGSVWRQVDRNERLNTRATAGTPVVVRQASLGSYMLSVNGARSLRVRREQ